ncbi:hypothetical protein [Robertmurraya kyonggiensis]|uniref:Uncharacterized protein n=1 Tax=Robertmurraya kyonggiensis TaxID=1037680 RepID=A0A4U1D071_9BACI|nr:hypothetical protein [Robertmurraya kyonggiensis]TKC15695.1 hypothetical protein FA727_16345 [Robertmurraya kyonggiensis]
MSESFRYYKVVETDGMDAAQLQKVLNDATDGFPEMQIDHVIGTKIILGFESMLNAQGRAQARAEELKKQRLAKELAKGLFNIGMIAPTLGSSR